MSEHHALSCHPDRWLVCSDALFTSLRDGWSATETAQSLMRLRFSKGLVESVSLQAMADRAVELAGAMPTGTLHIVLDRLTDSARDQLERLAGLESVAFHVWQEQPGSVLNSLVTPEREVLSSWETLKRCPAVHFVSSESHCDIDQDAYMRAIRHWETNAREDDASVFDATYGPQVVRLVFEAEPMSLPAKVPTREALAAFSSEPVQRRKSDLRRWASPEPHRDGLRLAVTLPGKFYDEVSLVLTAGYAFPVLDSLCMVEMRLRDATCTLAGTFLPSLEDDATHQVLLLDSGEFGALRDLPWQDAAEELFVTFHHNDRELV